ncbi:hypothetical protein SeMB42_g04094 [Synchytrium endobioticum]|uniref:Transcription factor BYE1 n=1 Tax=Synchytrium endobioticum TaxID=286115 RepID=A0A507CP68_9FUNG|nr:hypothetical protein SeLEV6574_g06333 [Synchytrium endobioticum]TPX45116.1 hypothetical protein SeMB42_g04094 [Synchytrium endobioticum]
MTTMSMLPSHDATETHINQDISTANVTDARQTPVLDDRPTHDEEGRPLYCICRKPDESGFMIECDYCMEWYHGDCINITKKIAKSFGKQKWACPLCRQKGIGQPMPHEAEYYQFSDDNDAAVDPDSDDYRESDVSEGGKRKKKAKKDKNSNAKSKVKNNHGADSEDDGSDGEDESEKDEGAPRSTRKAPFAKGPKCALRGCNRPAKPNNEYCSKEHAQAVTGKRPDKSKERRTSSASKQGSTDGAVTSDKTRLSSETVKFRRKAREAFAEQLEAIFKEAKSGVLGHVDVAVNLKNWVGFAKALETEIFNTFGERGVKGRLEAGDKYKSKVRSVLYNLKDKSNTRFRKIIVTGQMDAQRIVHAAPEELGNEDIVNLTQNLEKQAMKTLIISPSDAVPIVKKTHKGEIEIEYNPPSTPVVNAPIPIRTQKSDISIISSSSNSTSGMHVGGGHEDRKGSLTEAPVLAVPLTNSGDSTPTRPDSRKRSASGSTATSPKRIKKGDDVHHHNPASPSNPGDLYDTEEDYFRPTEDDVGMDVKIRAWTPEGTPPPLPESMWEGQITMQNVAKFHCSAKQVSGNTIAEGIEWKAILPETLIIEGRIAIDRAEKYMSEQHRTSSKQVIVVLFKSGNSSEDEKNSNDFFDYFYTKSRYAVVKEKPYAVKDMYVCCIKKDDRLPSFVRNINGCQLPPGPAQEDMMLGCILVANSALKKLKRETSLDFAGNIRNNDIHNSHRSSTPPTSISLPPLPANLSNHAATPPSSQAASAPANNPLAMMLGNTQPGNSAAPIPNPILALLNNLQQQAQQSHQRPPQGPMHNHVPPSQQMIQSNVSMPPPVMNHYMANQHHMQPQMPQQQQQQQQVPPHMLALLTHLAQQGRNQSQIQPPMHQMQSNGPMMNAYTPTPQLNNGNNNMMGINYGQAQQHGGGHPQQQPINPALLAFWQQQGRSHMS